MQHAHLCQMYNDRMYNTMYNEGMYHKITYTNCNPNCNTAPNPKSDMEERCTRNYRTHT